MATDQEMMDRIAKLSNAIEQQKHTASNRGGYYARGRPFRGRGGNMSLSNTLTRHPVTPYYPANNKYINPATVKPPSTTTYVNPSIRVNHQHRNLAVSTPAPPMATPLPPQSRNKKLIINHKGNNATTSNTMVKSIDTATGRKQVAIDGVDFVVKGKKLIRKDLFDSNMTKTNLLLAKSTAPKVLVRKSIKSSKRRDKNKNMVIGTAPIVKRKPATVARRHHAKGNMVFVRGPEGYVRQGRSGKSLVLNSHKGAIKKPRYCGFYTRYGKCPNGARCPFVHDINRRAICPRFLQNRCKKSAAECRLSHTPNPHIMPHCVHFQKGHCTNDPCMYAHVLVSKDAPVCRAFAMEGYCPKGLECVEKHVHVCPEFAETGKCSNANCRLPHVARRSKQDQAQDSNKAAGIVRLGSWVSPQYYHAQKMAKAEKRKAVEEAAAAKVWTRPSLVQEAKEQAREKEEEDGFVRLFDDSDEDDGWSQYERSSDAGVEGPLRFREDEADEEEDEDEDEDASDEGDANEDDENENDDENDEEGDQNQAAENMEQDATDEDSDQDDFFDAVDSKSPVNEEDSDAEEVYEEASDAEMSDA
ncbi:hypothetical protein MBANPS3_011721 [Mucor bainieri]